MSIATVRRIASKLLGVGESRVRFVPDELESIKTAITRSDVSNLISQKSITVIPVKGKRTIVRKRKRGRAHKRGRSTRNQKEVWMEKVRAQRKYLRELVSGGSVDRKWKRMLYGKVKSGIFKNKKTLYAYLKENNLVVEKV